MFQLWYSCTANPHAPVSQYTKQRRFYSLPTRSAFATFVMIAVDLYTVAEGSANMTDGIIQWNSIPIGAHTHTHTTYKRHIYQHHPQYIIIVQYVRVFLL